MYNNATNSYTMESPIGNLDWVVTNMTPADVAGITDKEIYEWVDRMIEQEIDSETSELEDSLHSLTFPRFGYSTSQRFDDADEYTEWKREEIKTDLKAERDYVFNFIKEWIAEGTEAPDFFPVWLWNGYNSAWVNSLPTRQEVIQAAMNEATKEKPSSAVQFAFDYSNVLFDDGDYIAICVHSSYEFYGERYHKQIFTNLPRKIVDDENGEPDGYVVQLETS